MHIAHLALYPDTMCSILLDITDDEQFICGGSRDRRLSVLWDSYRSWCEEAGAPECGNCYFPEHVFLFNFTCLQLFAAVHRGA